MGAVYRVYHRMLQKDLALKTFRSAQIDEETWLRFQREAQAIGKVQHSNIISIYDFGITQDNKPYYAMELLRGDDLARHISNGDLTLKRTLQIFALVAGALEHAHKSGIVHRDIKPANIHVDMSNADRPDVKLVDFGIAKLASADSQKLTGMGLIFGSPLYMSPEQAAGRDVDHRTDIYSLGCTLFEALTDSPPFLGKTIVDTLTMHQEDNPPTLAQVNVGLEYPQRLEGLLRRMLAKDPDKRCQSMQEVKNELQALMSQPDNLLPKEKAPAQEKNFVAEALSRTTMNAGEREAPLENSGLSKKVIVLSALALLLVGAGTAAVWKIVEKLTVVADKTEKRDLGSEITYGLRDEADKALDSGKPTPEGVVFKDKDGRQMKRLGFGGFDFGTYTDLNTGISQRANGTIIFPANAKILWTVSKDTMLDTDHLDWVIWHGVWEMQLPPGCRLSHAAAKHIKNIDNLHSLIMRDVEVPYVSIKELSRLKLHNVDLGYVKLLTADDVSKVKWLKKCNRVALDGMKDVEEALDALSESEDITSLRLDDTKLTEGAQKAIGNMANLRVLEVRNCAINDTRLNRIIGKTDLRRLHLGNCEISEKSIETLERLPNLKCLTTNLPPESALIAKLQQAMDKKHVLYSNTRNNESDMTAVE